MERVAIVTDSIACLPRELAQKYSIEVVPITFVFGEKVYRDGELGSAEFYELLRTSPRLPTTAHSSPGTYLETYRQVSSRASAILCITIASGVTAQYQSARIAMELAEEALPSTAIRVLDSQTATGAQALVVLGAARAAARGESLEQVAAAAEALIPRLNLVATVDTLYYLVKGGRVPKIAGLATSLLKIKPIFQLQQGAIEALGRPRTRARAVRRVLEIAKERVRGRPVHFVVMHSNVPEEAEALRRQVEAEFDCRELFVTEFTPVMGIHAGPGVLALAFYCEEESDVA